MKSDIIRKRSRHDSRRNGHVEETPSASPGASRRPSPSAPQHSPILGSGSDGNGPLGYGGYQDEYDFATSPQSELMSALSGGENAANSVFGAGGGMGAP